MITIILIVFGALVFWVLKKPIINFIVGIFRKKNIEKTDTIPEISKEMIEKEREKIMELFFKELLKKDTDALKAWIAKSESGILDT